MAPLELELELVEDEELLELEEEEELLELEDELLLDDELEELPSSPAQAKSAAVETSTPANFIARITSDSDRIVSIIYYLGFELLFKKRLFALQLFHFGFKNLHHDVTREQSDKP